MTRLGDGRWRITSTKYTYREADERLAIARYHDYMAKQKPDGNWVDLPVGESQAYEIGPLVKKATKHRLVIVSAG